MKKVLYHSGQLNGSLHYTQAAFKKMLMLLHLLVIMLLIIVFTLGYYCGKDSAESIKRAKQKQDAAGLPRIPPAQLHRFLNQSK